MHTISLSQNNKPINNNQTYLDRRRKTQINKISVKGEVTTDFSLIKSVIKNYK